MSAAVETPLRYFAVVDDLSVQDYEVEVAVVAEVVSFAALFAAFDAQPEALTARPVPDDQSVQDFEGGAAVVVVVDETHSFAALSADLAARPVTLASRPVA